MWSSERSLHRLQGCRHFIHHGVNVHAGQTQEWTLPRPLRRSEDRLGCQIVMSDKLDGLVVKLPAGTRNMMG